MGSHCIQMVMHGNSSFCTPSMYLYVKWGEIEKGKGKNVSEEIIVLSVVLFGQRQTKEGWEALMWWMSLGYQGREMHFTDKHIYNIQVIILMAFLGTLFSIRHFASSSWWICKGLDCCAVGTACSEPFRQSTVICFLLVWSEDSWQNKELFLFLKHSKAILSLAKHLRHLSYLMQLHGMMGEKEIGGGEKI